MNVFDLQILHNSKDHPLFFTLLHQKWLTKRGPK